MSDRLVRCRGECATSNASASCRRKHCTRVGSVSVGIPTAARECISAPIAFKLAMTPLPIPKLQAKPAGRTRDGTSTLGSPMGDSRRRSREMRPGNSRGARGRVQVLGTAVPEAIADHVQRQQQRVSRPLSPSSARPRTAPSRSGACASRQAPRHSASGFPSPGLHLSYLRPRLGLWHP